MTVVRHLRRRDGARRSRSRSSSTRRGEAIVATGATAAQAGLGATVVPGLAGAFLETAALWWLYFGAAAEQTRAILSACEDPGRLARDAYTYLLVPIVAGIVAALPALLAVWELLPARAPRSANRVGVTVSRRRALSGPGS